jgi:HEAT repeat protein
MANRRIEEQIERLGKLREDTAGSVAELRKALGDRVNLVAAKAAKMTAELHLEELVPDLLRAFDRLIEKPVERDPQCWGKNAIAKALVALDWRESAVYLRGARHVQMEPVWGGQADTAQTLRGTCLLALVACTDIDRDSVLRALVNALTETDPPVRADAVTALAQMGGSEAALLLRLKARAGDEEAPIIGQALEAVLRIEGAEAVPFVAEFLHGGGQVAEEAALALGASRVEQAVELLEAAWKEARNPEFREVLLRAISAARLPRALEFLLRILKSGRLQDARAAIEALEMHKGSPEIVRQIRDAATGRTDLAPRMHQLFR